MSSSSFNASAIDVAINLSFSPDCPFCKRGKKSIGIFFRKNFPAFTKTKKSNFSSSKFIQFRLRWYVLYRQQNYEICEFTNCYVCDLRSLDKLGSIASDTRFIFYQCFAIFSNVGKSRNIHWKYVSDFSQDFFVIC